MAPMFSLSAAGLALMAAASFASSALADTTEPQADAACTHNVTAKLGDSCVSVAAANGITVAQFIRINPTIRTCTLSAGVSYCVSTVPLPVESSSSATSSAASSSAAAPSTPAAAPTSAPFANASSSTASAGAAAPSQGAGGLIPSPDGSDGICGGEYTCLGSVYGECCSANGYCGGSAEYCGEGCNPAYGQCGVCPAQSPPTTVITVSTVTAVVTTTSVLVSTLTTTARVTVTAPPVTVTHVSTVTKSAANGVATPGGAIPGVTRTCLRWYLVRATDTCRRIALTYGTTQAQITSWNPNFDCDDIEDMAGNYICVAVLP